MSEQAWLTSGDPRQLLAIVRRLVKERQLSPRSVKRKLRLFVVALFHQLRQDANVQSRCDDLVQLAVGHADGTISLRVLRAANEQLEYDLDLANTGFLNCPVDWLEESVVTAAWLEASAALELAYFASLPDPWEAAENAVEVLTELSVRLAAKKRYAEEDPTRFAEVDFFARMDQLTELVRASAERPARGAVCAWVRELFGNPFQPMVLTPAWLSQDVVRIAQQVYNERAFELLPILADALEEAGCDVEPLLLHCRTPGVHTQGCWAVDQVRGQGGEAAGPGP